MEGCTLSDQRIFTFCSQTLINRQLNTKRTYFRQQETSGSSDNSTWEGKRDSSVIAEGKIHSFDDSLDIDKAEEEISTSICQPISDM